jgi:osmotically-inducible protein OsmY
MRNKRNRKRTAVPAFAIALLIGGGMLTSNARSEPGVTDSSNSVSRENDKVNVKAEHHYNSPAERANDDLLITEVKSALAHDGVGEGYLIAGDIAAATEGVTAVNDQLTWH